MIFGQTVRHAFVNYDDSRVVYGHPQVARGLTAQGVVWAFTHRHFGNWVPLTCLSHMFDCRIYGLNPAGHHLTNVLLHAATVVLLFLVLRQMTGQLWPSALVAVLFAVHPLHVESVAWISERKDVLSALFFAITLGAYLNYVRHPSSVVRYVALIVCFAMGLMTKPMLVTLPAVLLLLDYWPLGRFAGSRRLDGTPRPISPHRNGGAFVDGEEALQTDPMSFSFHWRVVLEKLPLFLLTAASCVGTLTQGNVLEGAS